LRQGEAAWRKKARTWAARARFGAIGWSMIRLSEKIMLKQGDRRRSDFIGMEEAVCADQL
jgi:hypothetical protein